MTICRLRAVLQPWGTDGVYLPRLPHPLRGGMQSAAEEMSAARYVGMRPIADVQRQPSFAILRMLVHPVS
jgi:hypothetical protein